MVAFLPIVYEGKPPRFSEQPVNKRAREHSGTNFFKSIYNRRYIYAKGINGQQLKKFNNQKDHPGNTRHVTRGTSLIASPGQCLGSPSCPSCTKVNRQDLANNPSTQGQGNTLERTSSNLSTADDRYMPRGVTDSD